MPKVAHFERIPNGSLLLRVGPEGWCFGQPYELLVVVLDLGEGVCEIRGLDHAITIEHWRAMAEEGRKEGFHTAIFDRIKDGKKHRRELKLADVDNLAAGICPLSGICCPREP